MFSGCGVDRCHAEQRPIPFPQRPWRPSANEEEAQRRQDVCLAEDEEPWWRAEEDVSQQGVRPEQNGQGHL